jgi:5-methylcytosine-specific restriction endonuclease McrA
MAVFARDRETCRICRIRPAESMHEIVPRSLGGKVSLANSIAVCGDGVRGCHGFAQRHEIRIEGRADDYLEIQPCSRAAAEWMRGR